VKIIYIILFVFIGCIKQPAVEDASKRTALFLHTNFLNSCVNCHETKRPVALLGVAHGNGADCSGCHRPPSWLYSHNPNPTSCNSCHETIRPQTSSQLNNIPTAIVTNSHFNSQDCSGCHIPQSGASLSSWKFSHLPLPASCVSCHEIRRPVTVRGASHVQSGDCNTCHSTNTWVLAAHNPAPSSCISCHEIRRPLTSSHVILNGTITTTNSHYGPQDCNICHSTNVGAFPTAWAFNHVPKQTVCNTCHNVKRPITVNGSSHTQTEDCNSCHNTNNWLAINHSPTPSSCNSCHSINRPATASGHNTRLSSHYTSIDCKSCHSIPPTAGSLGWAFSAVNNCLLCHLSTGQREHGNNVRSCGQCHNPMSNRW
jgi:hypothetical protein